MAYESAIQAFEASRKKGPLGLFGSVSALIIRISPDAAHPLEMEMRHVNQHFMDWLGRRGNKCADLVLEFVISAALRPEVEHWVSRLLLQDCQHNEIISRLEIDCTIQDPTTGERLALGVSLRDLADSAHPKSDTSDASFENSSKESKSTEAGKDADESTALNTAIAEARRRIPEFKALLDSAQAGVTVRVPWVCNNDHDVYEASLVGRNGNELTVEFTPDYAPGPIRKTYRFEEILDWTVYHSNGQQTGGFTDRALKRLEAGAHRPSDTRMDLNA